MQTQSPWRCILSSSAEVLGGELWLDFHLLWFPFHSLSYFSSPWVRIANKQALRTQWLCCFFSDHSLRLPGGSESRVQSVLFRAPPPPANVHVTELSVLPGHGDGEGSRVVSGSLENHLLEARTAPSLLTPNCPVTSSPDQTEHVSLLPLLRQNWPVLLGTWFPIYSC